MLSHSFKNINAFSRSGVVLYQNLSSLFNFSPSVPYIFSVLSNNIFEVIALRYENLNQLIRGSRSSRRYFLSLPVNVQLKLHEHHDYIHTSEELRRCTEAIQKYERQVQISETYSFPLSGSEKE